ncbi:probable ubiquitin carboxyl-terminal hydrolase FAF-X [Planococcus citri]|uniref:probable ubiquitin carboxyl-terminal hydrolase FAF-X n=1 Tax=Planococcus citri TaxID=170843 RepID=UPI0031F83794
MKMRNVVSTTSAKNTIHFNILKEVQAIFGHLASTKLQYYDVPKGLWRNFRLRGELVNLREQQDTVEFFMSLIESINEASKALNHEQTMSKMLRGSFWNQKEKGKCCHHSGEEAKPLEFSRFVTTERKRRTSGWSKCVSL